MSDSKQQPPKAKCPYCGKPIETPVVRKIFQRRSGKAVETDMTFCSSDCGGYYQMGCEG